MKENLTPEQKEIAVLTAMIKNLEDAISFANPKIKSIRYYHTKNQIGIRFSSTTYWIETTGKDKQSLFYEVVERTKHD